MRPFVFFDARADSWFITIEGQFTGVLFGYASLRAAMGDAVSYYVAEPS